MDGSKGQPKMTAGLDLGDRYSYLCLIDIQSGEVVEDGKLRTTPQALRRRFLSEQPLRIAIETGTHSPWVSRLLEEYGHEVLVASVPTRSAFLSSCCPLGHQNAACFTFVSGLGCSNTPHGAD